MATGISEMWASAKAALEGMQAAYHEGSMHIWLELDSSTSVDMIED